MEKLAMMKAGHALAGLTNIGKKLREHRSFPAASTELHKGNSSLALIPGRASTRGFMADTVSQWQVQVRKREGLSQARAGPKSVCGDEIFSWKCC
jgi:hypothetical protein